MLVASVELACQLWEKLAQPLLALIPTNHAR